MKATTLFIFSIFLSFSCDKKQVSLDGFEYPEGIKVVDLKSENDCSLPKCSNDRILRLKAKDVYGLVVNDSIINIGWQSDGYIKLFLCNKLDPSQVDLNLDEVPAVIVSGDLYDACGTLNLNWPTIEYYFFELKKIRQYE